MFEIRMLKYGTLIVRAANFDVIPGELANVQRFCRGPSRNDSVQFGDRGRLARTGRRPADQTERTRNAPNGAASHSTTAIGETPMAATGTVALPTPTASFRLTSAPFPLTPALSLGERE